MCLTTRLRNNILKKSSIHKVKSLMNTRYGRSVIIGFQKTQIYQRFAGSRQEVFILHLDYALQVDSRFRPFIFPSIP